MSEPIYDEDIVNLGYLKKVISDTEENIDDIYKNVSRHYASKPQPPYNKGDTWIDGDIVYVCINSRQIGLYTDSDWVTESGAREEVKNKNKTYLKQPSNYSPGDMWILQSDNDHKAGKKGEILISTAGRAEYDEGDWINMLGYGTIRSINEVADNLNNAINRIGNVEEAIEDGIIITFYQDSKPEGKHIGDLWYVTGEIEGYTKGKIYRYDGTSWVILDDPAIQKAFDEANEARIVADGKIQSFYSATEPTQNVGVGDLWIDIDNNNQLYRYNGTKWVAVYDTRINELVVNVETVTERVATIETDLGEIDLRVSETTTTITTIQGDVNDIQDNIVSLQSQIDGSIQFWNGSDIPTASNYPASEWTTEEEKNKHRADIYTVIEDVDGELKQGKSYRFDKVGNTWQWIELTDNELSAVQALAQSKAKVFVTTPKVPYSIGDLWLNNGKLYECQVSKDASGSYSASDWKEAVNYTDDTVANLAKTLANNAQSTADSAVEGVSNITNTTGQAEGKNIHIEDSAEEPLVDISLHGESNQKTRSGRNLLKNSNKTQTINGVTFTVNIDGSITAKGTNGVNRTVYTVNANIPLKTNTKYTLSGCSNGSTSTYLMQVALNINGAKRYFTNSINPITFETVEETTAEVYIVIYENATIENVIIYPQLEEGSTATEYEPYGAMPSPDYPSEIENVEGKNKFDSAVLIDKGAVLQDDGSYYFATKMNNANFIPFYTNKQVVLSGLCKYDTDTSNRGNYLQFVYSDGTMDNGFTNTNKMFSNKYGKFYIVSDATKTVVAIGMSYGFEIGTYFKNIQLEESSFPTPYTPYNSIEIKVKGKNLFNNNFDDYIMPKDYRIYPIKLEKGKVYRFNTTLIGTPLTGIVVGIVKNGTMYSEFSSLLIQSINSSGGVNNPSFMIDDTWVSPKLVVYATTQTKFEEIFKNYNVQLVEGTEILDYEPYKSQIAYFPLAEGQKLMEGSYLADDGVHNVRGQIVLNGKEDFWNFNSSRNAFWFNNTNIKNCSKEVHDKICSHFPYTSNGYNIANVNTLCENTFGNTTMFIFKVDTTIANTVEAWKTHLAEQYANGTPVIVEYELAEEEIVPFTKEQQKAWNKIKALTTYKNITNITSDAYAKVVYMRDNGLDVYETKQNADKRYTETTEKFAETKITTDSIKDTVSTTQTTVANNYQELKGKFDDYAPKSDIITIQNSVEKIQTDTYTKTEINTKLKDGSVTKVLTTAGTFDENGLTIEKTNAKTKGNFNEKGITVTDATSGSSQELLFAGYDEELNETIVRSKNMTVEKYFVIGNTARQENYTNPVLGGKGVGVFML